MAQEQTALMAVTKDSWNNGMHPQESQRTIDHNFQIQQVQQRKL